MGWVGSCLQRRCEYGKGKTEGDELPARSSYISGTHCVLPQAASLSHVTLASPPKIWGHRSKLLYCRHTINCALAGNFISTNITWSSGRAVYLHVKALECFGKAVEYTVFCPCYGPSQTGSR
jgi:hypothetical protein